MSPSECAEKMASTDICAESPSGDGEVGARARPAGAAALGRLFALGGRLRDVEPCL